MRHPALPRKQQTTQKLQGLDGAVQKVQPLCPLRGQHASSCGEGIPGAALQPSVPASGAAPGRALCVGHRHHMEGQQPSACRLGTCGHVQAMPPAHPKLPAWLWRPGVQGSPRFCGAQPEAGLKVEPQSPPVPGIRRVLTTRVFQLLGHSEHLGPWSWLPGPQLTRTGLTLSQCLALPSCPASLCPLQGFGSHGVQLGGSRLTTCSR